ncbi:uncharacterized protein [Ptychodera flava]|uniref:uncharacterized protein n=1 Tax=Ptychodera flava TaxID=63121 RepID=UPI003969F480
MQPERPEGKDKTFPEKMVSKRMNEALVRVLFVFASWMTRLCNMPGLNEKIVRDFCAQHGIPTRSQNICSTIIDVEVSDDQKESAKSVGVTLIPARRKSSLDPQRHPPKLDWLLHHDIYYPSLGDLENVQYVVGHDSLTAEATKDIRDSLFPDAELHLLKVDLPGVLVVFDKWDIEKYGLPEFHRNLLKEISSKTGQKVKVYATVLDVFVSEGQKDDAENAGVTLIPGKRTEYVDPEKDPISMLWLYNHRSYYRDLKDLKNIQFVIGYAPMTAFAAADIRKSLFPNAKLYQINAIHPDHHAKLTAAAQHKLETDMLRVAEESDAMVSVGPKMYDYFDNAYRAITDRAIPHIELLPKVGECFTHQTLKVSNIVQQHVILSYGEFDCCADVVSDYDKIAESIGQIATVHKGPSGQQLKWNVLGIPTESSKKVQQHLSGLLSCDFEVTQLKPISSINQILTHIQQCHLCVTGSRHTDFGFWGLEAIAAGLPTYVNRDSQLGAFIIKYLSDYVDMCLINSAHQWRDKVTSAVSNTAMAFKWANELKKAYCECQDMDKSYARFAAFFKEAKEPCDGLDVTIELNSEPWMQHLQKLREQLEMMSRQQPYDQSAVAALKQTIQEVHDAFNQCQQSLKRKAEQTIHEDSEKLKRLCYEVNCGVNGVTNLKEGSLGMLVNFLSILGLYRFKSSVQTGKFAELYEPWLITDEMRERAAKVNLPLKLQVTYDKKKFDELDAFFIARDLRISDFSRQPDGKVRYRFEKQPQSKLLVEQPTVPLSKLDTDIEDKLVVGEHTGRQKDQQTQGQVLKVQPSKAREGKDPLEKQYHETLKEVAKANEDDQLENTMREMNEVMEQLQKARKEAEVFKTQLDEVKEGKLFSDKLNKERLEEIGKAVEVATKKAIEITSLKKKIQDLETKLAESSDFVTNLKAKLSDSERNLAESRGLVIKLQAQLSDSENKDKDIDSNPIKDEFDKAEKEIAHLKDQLDKATKVVTQLEGQLEIVVEEKSQIQEELDRERRRENVPQGAGKETGDLERDVKEKSDSGGMFSKLRKFVTGDSASNTEPKPIGTKRYVGKKKKVDGIHGGECMGNPIIGGEKNGCGKTFRELGSIQCTSQLPCLDCCSLSSV